MTKVERWQVAGIIIASLGIIFYIIGLFLDSSWFAWIGFILMILFLVEAAILNDFSK